MKQYEVGTLAVDGWVGAPARPGPSSLYQM